jgi:uncharacterized RmlC-like cupin family protein
MNKCQLVRKNETINGKQGLVYNVGISSQSVSSNSIHMQLVTIPPKGRAKAHKHEDHETAIYALKGTSGVFYGDNLEFHDIVEPGDFFYIPANVPHLPYNPSDTEEVVAVISRTDPNEQESVVLLPELEQCVTLK